METIQIEVKEYYNNSKYYPVMPEGIFNALEAAFLEGQETAEVLKAEYDKMLLAIQEKNK